MTDKATAARVLRDEPSHGLRAGQLVRAPASIIKGLADAGGVDPHPESVAYAESIGAEEVMLTEPAPRARKPRAAAEPATGDQATES